MELKRLNCQRRRFLQIGAAVTIPLSGCNELKSSDGEPISIRLRNTDEVAHKVIVKIFDSDKKEEFRRSYSLSSGETVVIDSSLQREKHYVDLTIDDIDSTLSEGEFNSPPDTNCNQPTYYIVIEGENTAEFQLICSQ